MSREVPAGGHADAAVDDRRRPPCRGESQRAADTFLAGLDERTLDRDTAATNEAIGAQVTALANWEQSSTSGLADVRQPVLVVNGDDA
ncbi:hypothetical protein [Lentzea flaviverrucosa]|uniref:Uncharacterized protein n=1 Tax=Lentzea flaviverrucosa TaxID=200379 RepID=A0A1H9BGK5_9PSEU|nr:hypothetical protein [Lentzea flaviverrucosa]RDI31787.1 hypothetical protein DFR72_103187 [Lentzea flaviverrucosa]SEP87753.1 hypothetical protein SAMN05216195_101470 [Lentzea flaviverrucosa]